MNAIGQPLQLESNDDDNEQLSLICNGEIYNSTELAEKYKFKYETANDCECILHLYKYFKGDLSIICKVSIINISRSFIITLYFIL